MSRIPSYSRMDSWLRTAASGAARPDRVGSRTSGSCDIIRCAGGGGDAIGPGGATRGCSQPRIHSRIRWDSAHRLLWGVSRLKVLVVGKGGREHALCWKLKQSSRVTGVFCAPGNAGTAIDVQNVAIEPGDQRGLLQFARREGIGLTVVGPEEPLAKGIVDVFQREGLRIFGPRKDAAELEGSKVFAKDLMRQAGIPTAD